MRSKNLILAILLMVPFAAWGGFRAYNTTIFDIRCGDYLKRAADANTVPLALSQMEIAMKFIEQAKLTSGYTSILYKSPSEDVGFWYQNLKASTEELRRVRPDATQLEASNVLMKLCETLLEQGEKGGVNVTIPRDISIFPSNTFYCIWGIVGIVLLVIGAYIIVIVLDNPF